MSNKRFLICVFSLLAVFALVLTSCAVTPVTEQSKEQSAQQNDTESALESEVSVSPEEVLAGAALAIENGGEKLIDKEISGTVVINTKEPITLVLKNATVKSDNGPAIYVLNSKELTIKLEGNSVLSDGASYAAAFAGAKGALFSEDDLLISGSGSLTVTGNYAHGLVCDDAIIVESGEITVVSAVKDAVHANDLVKISGGSLTVQQASGDGIHCEASVEISGGKLDINSKGDGIKAAANTANEDEISAEQAVASCNVTISGGEIKINSEEDGIQADSALVVSNGVIDVTTTGVVNKTNQGEQFPGGGGMFPGGGFGGGTRPGRGERPNQGTPPQDTPPQETPPQDTPPQDMFPQDPNAGMVQHDAPMDNTSTSTTQSDSSKGLKAGSTLTVSGGTVSINSTDDALHSNGNVDIQNGTINVKTNDDAVHADNAVTINGGTISVTSCYEGIEGMSIEINDGNISITSTDDGLNAADGTASNNRPGQANSANSLVINGGYLYVNAEGDGLDSNGTLTVNGGTVLVDGPNGRGNGPIDADGARLVNGGFLIATGGTDMLESPQAGSKQNCAVIYAGSLTANTTVALTNSKGEAIFCYTLSKAAQTLTISMPELEIGETYTLYTGVTPSDTASKLLYGNGVSFTGGREAASYTQSSVVSQAR